MGSPGGAAGSQAAEAGSVPEKLSLRTPWDAPVELSTRQSDARVQGGEVDPAFTAG